MVGRYLEFERAFLVSLWQADWAAVVQVRVLFFVGREREVLVVRWRLVL